MAASIMEQKLVQDYLKADAIDTAILMKQVQLSIGTDILDGLIPKIEADMKILDEEKYNEIKKKIDETTIEFKKESAKIIEKFKAVETTNDPYQTNQKQNELNNLKHEKQQKILTEIQNIAYRKGWLD